MIKHSKLGRKNVFRNDYFGTTFFLSCHFTQIFVHLLVLAAVRNFNVYKLTEWDPANV